MNGRSIFFASALFCGALSMTGCSNGQPRFKGLDSYTNATTTNAYEPVQGIDPYSYGGTAYASGGLAPGVSYGTGAGGPLDGDPAHFAALTAANGGDAWPIDWGTGALDSSGIVEPKPPIPIKD